MAVHLPSFPALALIPFVYSLREGHHSASFLIFSDISIAVAHFTIVLVLLLVLFKRKGRLYISVVLLFALFIGFRGTTQLLSIWTIWNSQYQLSEAIRAISTFLSVSTAIVLIRLLPVFRRIPSVSDLEREVMERRFAEAIAIRNEERFRALLESAPDAMVISGKDGLIELTNLATERLFGYSSVELAGKPVETLIPFNLRSHYKRDVGAFASDKFDGPLGGGMELRALRKDGTEFPVEISLSPLKGPNGVSITAAIRDISERKRAAEQLAEKMAELRNANEGLEQFAHIASHDLQEPLRMVASYTQLLARRYVGRLDADADEFIGFAVDGTVRMKRLIEDLLVYSRAGSGAPPVREFPSQAALESALFNLRLTIEERGAVVTQDVLPVLVSSDLQLTQIFQNLIGNAIKYCSESTPKIHISAVMMGEEWVFSVQDNGIGIAPEHFEKIFQIFQRLHGREEYNGTGIGLAICQRILHQLGGRIWVESERGHGSFFQFSLPKR